MNRDFTFSAKEFFGFLGFYSILFIIGASFMGHERNSIIKEKESLMVQYEHCNTWEQKTAWWITKYVAQREIELKENLLEDGYVQRVEELKHLAVSFFDENPIVKDR